MTDLIRGSQPQPILQARSRAQGLCSRALFHCSEKLKNYQPSLSDRAPPPPHSHKRGLSLLPSSSTFLPFGFYALFTSSTEEFPSNVTRSETPEQSQAEMLKRKASSVVTKGKASQ